MIVSVRPLLWNIGSYSPKLEQDRRLHLPRDFEYAWILLPDGPARVDARKEGGEADIFRKQGLEQWRSSPIEYTARTKCSCRSIRWAGLLVDLAWKIAWKLKVLKALTTHYPWLP